MNEAEASVLASTLADALSETLAACVAPEPEYPIHLVVEESSVSEPRARRVIAQLRRLLASPYRPQRPNSFQSHFVAQPALAISGSGGVRPIGLRFWTETRERGLWLSYELTGGDGVALALGGFRL